MPPASILDAPDLRRREADTSRVQVQIRLALVEADVRGVKDVLEKFRGALSRWTIAIVIFILGAAASGGGALFAYGRLQERADQTAASVDALRRDIHNLAGER